MENERTLRVGLVQMKSAPCRADENRAAAERLIRLAAARSAKLIQLPETWNLGFFPKEGLLELAEPADGESRALLSRLARELGVAIAGGSLVTRRGADVCNTFVYYAPDGSLLAEYDKLHGFTPSGERAYFRAGEKLCRYAAPGVEAGALLCYDLRFCELSRMLALSGARLLTVCAQWPESRIEDWRLLARARAVENQVFVTAVNGCGSFGGVQSGGRSIAVAPDGEILAEAGADEGVTIAALPLARADECRRVMDILADRRPELYAPLCAGVPDA